MINFKGKRIAILGLGIEGSALADFLVNKAKSIEIFDQKTEDELLKNAEGQLAKDIKKVLQNSKIKTNLNHYLESLDIKNFDIIFRSPSVYFNHPKLLEAKSAGAKVSSQIKLFMELCPAKVIGVTGTKGKGTTASLIYEMLKADTKIASHRSIYLSGNIGNAAISLISKIKKNDIVILELSNFQLADMDQSPEIAVVTNLNIDHLDYHKTAEEYFEAKFNILKFQTKDDVAILNLESTFKQIDNAKAQKIFFSSASKDSKRPEAIVVENDKKLYEVQIKNDGQWQKICDESEILLVGKHNLENIAAAALAARIIGADLIPIQKAAKKFKGLPYRLQLIREFKGIKFINDSFATNPGPTIAAINSFRNDKVLILGGSSKNADFNLLAKTIQATNVKAVILIGVEGPRIKEALLVSGYKGKLIEAENDIRQIVKKSYEVAKLDDVVLFSPACASFDMFRSYKDRGEKFTKAVMSL
jgi:UDP-N-acetylmuramoylalanine--D-glutamate ligase